ncbi:hypothetical protein ELY33_14550 [Vreelandella andesensis]|uniref:Uncharacterized protein n=1 Tax=Vreelandella andesensis TaxID=447567 RepID=A0A433KGB4_9GAMM|nr:hypothetical protein [Halomonas andesensis]RUR27815.1 hypothetical protein ELY33_14550 [Halomonas andesensis]
MERSPLTDNELRLQVSYLARYMAESDNRRSLEASIGDSPHVKRWLASDMSTLASMGADLHQQQLGSVLGRDAGLAVFGAGLLIGEMFDGSMDRVSQAFLTPEMASDDANEAKVREAFHELITSRADAIAASLGWEAVCEFGCEPGSTNVIYVLRNPGDAPLSYPYIYSPDEVVMRVQVSHITPVDPSDPIGAFLGFQPTWKTDEGNTFATMFYTDPLYDESGKLVFNYQEEHNYYYPAVRKKIEDTHFGIALKHAFHSTPYSFYGNADVFPSQFIYNGGVYSLQSNSKDQVINQRMAVPGTLPGF